MAGPVGIGGFRHEPPLGRHGPRTPSKRIDFRACRNSNLRQIGSLGAMTLNNATILLAEDDPNDVFFIKRGFEKARLVNPLQVVQDGEQAIEYLKGDGPYADRAQFPFPFLLLLDLRLPRKSGFEVLGWLRQQPGLKRLTTVVLTSSKEGPDINRAYDLGANSYLLKPPDAEALLELFQRLNGYWVALNKPPDCSAP